MTETTRARTARQAGPARPVLLAWSRVAAGVDPNWLEEVSGRLDGPVCVLGKSVGKAASVGRGPSDLSLALEQIARRHPGRAVLVLRSGLEPPAPLPAYQDTSKAASLRSMIAGSRARCRGSITATVTVDDCTRPRFSVGGIRCTR